MGIYISDVVFRRTDLGSTEKLLYGFLHRIAKDRVVEAYNKEIGQVLCISPRRVSGILSALARAGLIELLPKPRQNERNRWRML